MKTLVIKPNYSETTGVLCLSCYLRMDREHFCRTQARFISTASTPEVGPWARRYPSYCLQY